MYFTSFYHTCLLIYCNLIYSMLVITDVRSSRCGARITPRAPIACLLRSSGAHLFSPMTTMSTAQQHIYTDTSLWRCGESLLFIRRCTLLTHHAYSCIHIINIIKLLQILTYLNVCIPIIVDVGAEPSALRCFSRGVGGRRALCRLRSGLHAREPKSRRTGLCAT